MAAVAFAAACTTSPRSATTTAATTTAAATQTAAPREVSAAEMVDHEGDSTETAVTVPPDAPEEGVRWENDWIFDRIGRFRRLSQGTGTLQGRRYDVIEVETPNGDKKKDYFDITENWKKWRPPQ